MNTCPECGSCLNATVTITLYDVQLKQGEIVSYGGGPTAEADLQTSPDHPSSAPKATSLRPPNKSNADARTS
jgi:hypothetical protein